LVLSREPLGELEKSEYNMLNDAAIYHFGTGIEELVSVKMEGCEY